jgi:hypothetical protein
MPNRVATLSVPKEAMRNLDDIRRELDELAERRTRLWKELSAGADAEKSAEVAALNARIEALWNEARVTRNRLRFGDPDAIIARARADERLEREYAKVA